MTATVTAQPLEERPADTASWFGVLRGSPALFGVTVTCLLTYLLRGISEQYTYQTTGFDLGIFDQAVRAYAHFKAPMVALKGPGYDVLGDHFHPILVTLAPLYWIWDSPYMLVIAQAFLIAASIPVVYRFALRRMSSKLALLISTIYALGWPVQALIDFDFHEIAFATPFLAFALDALDRRDDRSLLIWSLLLLTVREDMGVIVALLGLLRLAGKGAQGKGASGKRGAGRWLAGHECAVALVLIGAVAYLVITSWIIPHFASGHQFAYGSQYDSLGNSVGEALGNIVRHPLKAAELLVSPDIKLRTLRYLLVPLAFIPLRSRYSLLVLPLLAERFFNSRSNLWGQHFHYNALPWLILVLAMVDGAHRLGLFRPTLWAGRGRKALAIWLVAFPLLLIVDPSPDGPIPFTKGRDGVLPHIDAHVRAEMAVVKQIPASTCVEVANALVPHLTMRNYVSLANTQNWTADFIALDMSAKDVGGNPPAATPQSVYEEATTRGYQVVYRAEALVLLRSSKYSGPTRLCTPLAYGNSLR